MLAKLQCASLHGLDAEPVEVEVDLARGLPSWNLIGLPEGAVREARDRIRAAIINSGFEFPLRRITVNLSPADRRKDGSHFDLAIAIALLQASGQLAPNSFERISADKSLFLIGELALDGTLNRINGTISLALFALQQGYHSLIVPVANQHEAAAIAELKTYVADSLLNVVKHIEGGSQLPQAERHPEPEAKGLFADMREVRGQSMARRALEVAAAGAHHLLMSGSPGVGKSMLAKRLPGILPPMTHRQSVEVTRIYSVAGDNSRAAMSSLPPFREPHHSASDIAIIGGGSNPKPGEISKADHGVLFLDELPEHKRTVLETLRQPLEDGKVSIARAAECVTFPARFQLIAAMNPCPCGFLGHPTRACRCSPSQIHRYIGRISGPLLDRFDLRIHVPPVEPDQLAGMQPGEPSSTIAARVIQAREMQYRRLGEGITNARMQSDAIERYARPDADGSRLIERAMQHFSLSARSYHRILKVARTIADLDQSDAVKASHVAEALQYRGESQLQVSQ